MKQKKTALNLIETVLHMAIRSNLVYCTTISDAIDPNDPSDLGDRMIKLVLNTVSDDTLIFLCILDILYLEKMRKKIAKN